MFKQINKESNKKSEVKIRNSALAIFEEIFKPTYSLNLFIGTIAISAVLALIFEITHLWSYKTHTSYTDNTLNLETEACRYSKERLKTHHPNQNFDDHWKSMISILRCSLLSSPDIQIAVNELEAFVAAKKHSESVSSALGTLVALITLVFSALAWLTSKWFFKFMTITEETTKKQNAVDKILKKLEVKTKISDKIIAVKDEIVSHGQSISGKSLSNATEDAWRYRIYLDYLATEQIETHEKAARVLGSFYYSASVDYDFKHFREFLNLCQQQHELPQKYLDPRWYFGDS